ncbi:MAG: NifB/NifX family molybdenum-iron cluster-binding protein [Bacteroidetes bacterium]|nr:NifB/NifX family molybdenum-iron cluster-binding protein [Bacteroidota bacterium]MBU1578169.1 NifB/NifX family molybdenum-iron cluster-binding protein [Bacteroidota bacterium]
MKIVFTSSGTDWDALIDPRFGRTAYLVLFNEDTAHFEVIDNGAVQADAHGAGTATAQQIYALHPDVLITGNGPGETAAKALKNLNMRIYVDAHNLSLKEAYLKYQQNALKAL